MKTNIGKRIKIFWDIHKVEILFWTGFAATVAVGAVAAERIHDAKEKKRKEQDEQVAALMDAFIEEKEEERKADPLNTVSSGGDIANYYDISSDDYEMTEFVINDIPISSMGDFGKNIVAISKERFPEFGEFDTAQMILELRHSEQQKEDETDGEHSED